MTDTTNAHAGEQHIGDGPDRFTKRDDDENYGYPFKQCSYCGSIDPEDLIRFLKEGCTMHSADWKYGWPHKFYIDGIPNPKAGVMVTSYVTCDQPPKDEMDRGEWELYETGYFNRHDGSKETSYRQSSACYSAPKHTNAKFYSVHLKDLTPEAFTELADLIAGKTGVRFKMVDGKLMYSA